MFIDLNLRKPIIVLPFRVDMSSSDCERLISTNPPSLPISEVIDHIKHSFLELHQNEFQSIIRECDMKTEMENLTRERDSAKQQVCFLERNLDLAELEKLKLEDKLQKNHRKCEEFEKTINRLLEEKRASIDREKRAKELLDKISSENSKMEDENNMLVLETRRLVGVQQEKYKRLDSTVVKMRQEIEDLGHEKIGAKRTIDELRVKTLESDKVAELYKSRLQNLSPRIKKIEDNLAAILSVEVGDLPGLLTDLRKLDDNEEGGNLEFQKIWGKNDINSRNADVVVLWPGVRSISNSTASPSIGLSNEGAGRFSKTARPSSSGAGEVVGVIDSDDEAKPGRAHNVSKGFTGSNVTRDTMRIVESPSSGQRSKRMRTGCMGGLFVNSQTPLEKCVKDEVL